jgi:ABC-2 type transport system permease protein
MEANMENGKRKLKLVRMFYLYFRLMGQNLKALLEYQSDFFIMIVASAFTQVLGFIFISVVYIRIPDIQGWKFWEVAFIYAMIFFTEGAASFFFEGTWTISRLVNRGEMDVYLIRPLSPVLQVLSSRMGVNGIGNMVIGGVIISQAIHNVQLQWTPAKVILSVILFISAIIIRVCINFASNSAVFWTQTPANSFPFMIHSICDFAKYPITIYSFMIQAAVTLVIPYAFISFFPAAYVFGKGDMANIGLIGPFAAVYCVIVSLWIFYAGLKRYESAGN